jgi:cation diffusion facilitator family transporter
LSNAVESNIQDMLPRQADEMKQVNLTRYAWLSIAAAVATITLKAGAYVLTGSVGLLSDALESIINLVAAIIALWVLKVAAQPPDEDHMFGYGKVEYFSSGIEGSLIFLAAVSIGYAAVIRLLNPRPLEQIGIGLAISIFATVINLFVALTLLRVGRARQSIVLEADGHHLMTDVWTSVGVIVGVGAVTLTGWWRLDPIVAILVAVNILWSGWKLIKRSVMGLIDTAVPKDVNEKIVAILDGFAARETIGYHALRTRQSGAFKFIYVHILVPGRWSVQQGHDLLEKLEAEVQREISSSVVFTHLEPEEDPVSYQDIELIRNKEDEKIPT